jgi:hypothetical protein
VSSESSQPPSLDLPPGWPEGWPTGYEPAGGFGGFGHDKLNDGTTVYRRVPDDVEMVLVQGEGADPFLVDVRQVTRERWMKSGFWLDTDSSEYARRFPEAPGTSLVVSVTCESAKRYAKYAEKELMTDKHWAEIMKKLGQPDPESMFKVSEAMGGAPASVPWPDGGGGLGGFEIGVREIVRLDQRRPEAFGAVGFSLSKPRGEFGELLTGEAKRVYFKKAYTRTIMNNRDTQTDIGFRCMIHLDKK